MNENDCTNQTVNLPSMSKPSVPTQDVAPVFAALGNTVRLSLLVRLNAGDRRSIVALSANTRLTRQAITRHLYILRDAGLVISDRVGPENRFTYRSQPMTAARAYLDKIAGPAKRWPPPMPDQQVIALDRVFYALSSSTRLSMLRDLTPGERNISELAAPFAMSFVGAAKHVKVLEASGLVSRRVEGHNHVCRIEPRPLIAADDWLSLYENF